MRIGIACHPTYGGSGVVATELGKELAKRGHSIHFITYDVPFRLDKFDQNIKVHHVDVPDYAVFLYPPHDLAFANLMAQVVNQYQLDIMHVHYAIPYSVYALLAREMANRSFYLVTTLHGTDVTVLGEAPSLKKIIELGINNSDAVTAVSDSLVEETKEKFTVNVPIQRIYNFVDPYEYRKKEVSQLRLKYASPEEKILLHVSNFRFVKRPKDVVSVFEKVQRKIPAKLLLVGAGPELPSIKRYVQELGLSSKVIFLGKQRDVTTLYSLADLLLIPSEKESFGLVAIEAMSSGVPVIASNAGGLPEVIDHGKTGFLSPVGDVSDMAKNALRLLQDPTMYQLFSVQAVEKVKKEFAMERIVGQYESLYQRLLSRGGSDNLGQEKESSCSYS